MVNKEYTVTLTNKLQSHVDDLHRCGRPEVAFDLQETAICLANTVEELEAANRAVVEWHSSYYRVVNWLNIIGGVALAAVVVWLGVMILQAAGSGM